MTTEQGSSPGDTGKGLSLCELEAQQFYHGFRPKADVIPLLKEIGDYLVRASNAKHQHTIVISVRAVPAKKSKKKEQPKVENADKKMAGVDEFGVSHLIVVWEKEAWRLNALLRKDAPLPPGFDTILELIYHYHYNRLPQKICLTRPIPKPNWCIKHDTISFNKKDLLGSGNFCDVYKGIYHKTEQDTMTVAVKVWHEKSAEQIEEEEQAKKERGGEKVSKMEKEAKDARNAMISEAQIMSYYQHRHIIHLFGVCCDHLPVLIVMEYCAGGNLEQHLRKQGPKITPAERLLYCFEAACGMRYLHSKNCIHRDLAARNCLISNNGLIKITDFGLSQMMPEEMKPEAAVANLQQETIENDPKQKQANDAMNKAQVPLRWMAPESLVRPVQYSFKTDVWSYGVLVYEIFNNGEKPWADEPNVKKIAHFIRKGEMVQMPNNTPPELKKLVEKKMWAMKPEERPNMSALSQTVHHIFKQTKLPPMTQMTVNTLEGVKRSKERDETQEVGDNDTGDDVTKVGTPPAPNRGTPPTPAKPHVLRSKTEAPMKTPTTQATSDTAPKTPTNPSTDGTKELSSVEKHKKASDNQTKQPSRPKSAAVHMPVKEGMKKSEQRGPKEKEAKMSNVRKKKDNKSAIRGKEEGQKRKK